MKTGNWRPTRLSNFIGQSHIVEELAGEIEVVKADRSRLTNRIFYGPPGLGKTSLAAAIAAEAGVKMFTITGKEATLQTVSDVLAQLPIDGYEDGTERKNPRAGYVKDPSRVRVPILLFDEVDAADRSLLQMLHPIMEGPKADGSPHVFNGLDSLGRSYSFWLPALSFFLNTNYLGDLIKKDRALLSRCAHPVEFKPYNVSELIQIIQIFAKETGVKIEEEAAGLIADRSRDTPRNATQLLRESYTNFRAEQLRGNKKRKIIDVEIVEKTFKLKRIDSLGLDDMSRQYLRVIGETSEKRKMGLESIADELGLDPRTVELVVEPYIRRIGLARKGHGGRWITDAGRQAAGIRVHNPAALRAMATA